MNKNSNKKIKIAVAMSGGVDSAVAAKLLKLRGHEVVGIFLKFWRETGPNSGENKCCSDQALFDAKLVAKTIGIPLYTINLSKIFKEKVVDDFLSIYASGKTPNPCVRCNQSVKLGYLLKLAKKIGFNRLATGHYVKNIGRRAPNGEVQYRLFKARDLNKDQSYFLYTLSQAQLKNLLFPLGGYEKTQVRRMAKKFNLPVAEKKESQEICFIKGKSHNEFLKKYLKLQPGLIKTLDNRTVGAHQGLPLYTVGQRKGIAIGGTGPYYAVKMDYKKNILYVVNNKCDENLYCSRFTVKRVNWLSGKAPASTICQTVIRYHHPPVECEIKKIKKDAWSVTLNKPQRAVMPGQSAVFYRNDEVLGGGIIENVKCKNQNSK